MGKRGGDVDVKLMLVRVVVVLPRRILLRHTTVVGRVPHDTRLGSLCVNERKQGELTPTCPSSP